MTNQLRNRPFTTTTSKPALCAHHQAYVADQLAYGKAKGWGTAALMHTRRRAEAEGAKCANCQALRSVAADA